MASRIFQKTTAAPEAIQKTLPIRQLLKSPAHAASKYETFPALPSLFRYIGNPASQSRRTSPRHLRCPSTVLLPPLLLAYQEASRAYDPTVGSYWPLVHLEFLRNVKRLQRRLQRCSRQ